MDYRQYQYVNKTLSSEMFYSMMAIFHEKLPIATTFFMLKKKFRGNKVIKNCGSPIITIASPNMIKGLSINKSGKKKTETPQIQVACTPDIIIKNLKGGKGINTSSN